MDVIIPLPRTYPEPPLTPTPLSTLPDSTPAGTTLHLLALHYTCWHYITPAGTTFGSPSPQIYTDNPRTFLTPPTLSLQAYAFEHFARHYTRHVVKRRGLGKDLYHDLWQKVVRVGERWD